MFGFVMAVVIIFVAVFIHIVFVVVITLVNGRYLPSVKKTITCVIFQNFIFISFFVSFNHFQVLAFAVCLCKLIVFQFRAI
jgi:hypothetical protein